MSSINQEDQRSTSPLFKIGDVVQYKRHFHNLNPRIIILDYYMSEVARCFHDDYYHTYEILVGDKKFHAWESVLEHPEK